MIVHKTFRSTLAWMVASLILGAAACKQEQPEQSLVAKPVNTSLAVASASPATELATLDARVPVPLQPMMAWHQKQNMMQHLVAIQQLTAGLAHKDWEAVAVASKSLGSTPQMKQMCQHMGAGAEGFTEAALDFHQRADAISEAASRRSVSEVLHTTAVTLQACTSCHAVYRQEVVDSVTWQTLTRSNHSPSKHDG